MNSLSGPQKSVVIRADDFTSRIYSDPSGKTLPYRLLIPSGYDKTQQYPLFLYFHGAAERGVDNAAQLRRVGRNSAAPSFQSEHPCFVLVPQCPPNQKWVDMSWEALSGVRPVQPSAAMQLALKILDEVTAEFSVDKNRIYTAGLSMGGFAVWDCVTRYPDRFAAGIICCGGGDENTVTTAVAQVPVWVFHSADDKVVSVVRARNMVAAMTKMGGHPRYTEYQEVGHDCWDKACAEPDLFPWLFQQQLSQPATP